MDPKCVLFGYWLEKHFEVDKHNSFAYASEDIVTQSGGSKGKKNGQH